MAESPWTSLDPQPGDFDADLVTIDPRFVETHRANPDAKVRVVVSIEGDDADRLRRVAAARGETPSELIAELLREADSRA